MKRDDDLLKGSLNRMDDCLHFKLPAEQHAAIDRAIRTLRTIRQARNAEQHGITEGGGLTAKLRDLGIHDAPPNWAGAWDAVRARTVEALTALRHELMAYVNRPQVGYLYGLSSPHPRRQLGCALLGQRPGPNW